MQPSPFKRKCVHHRKALPRTNLSPNPMKPPIVSTALFAALVTSYAADAAVVTVTQNINTFLTSPNTSPHSQNVVFNDGAGNTVTLQFTLSTTGNAAFTSLDGATRVGVASGDGNHVSTGEDVSFKVAYLSSTGTVDLNSIAFRFDSIGFRNLSSSANLSWQLNGGSINTFATTPTTNVEDFYTVESGFTTIGTGANNYTGVFRNDASVGQFTTNDTNSSLSGQGLKFSVQFIPEPSVALLGGLSALMLLRRRRM